MKTKLFLLLIALTIALGNLKAQKVVEVKATNYDISDNLDLEAVASIFGDSKNLSDFEKRLNDAGTKISNLDLNEDGYVDFLRVVEFTDNGEHFITIQAVLGADLYQDVATIELGRESDNNYSIIIVGNHFIYGNDFMIRPVYVYQPSIFTYFFSPIYQPWHSPYYWGYYPIYYTYRTPYQIHRYRNHIHRHINYHHHYEYVSYRDHHHSNDYYSNHSRNDYGSKHPEKSFENRNSGAKNKLELNQNRRSSQPNSSGYGHAESKSQTKQTEKRRAGVIKERERGNTSPVNRSTTSPDQNRSGNKEGSVNETPQRKSESIEIPATKKSDDKPAFREKSTNKQVKSRSTNNTKPDSPKVNKGSENRSQKVSGNQNKRSTSEKKVTTVKKSTENKSRR